MIVKRFKEDQEAIDVANDTEYGLAASVHSADINRASRIAAEINVGTVSPAPYSR